MPVYERQWLSRKPVPPGRRLAPILGGNQAVQDRITACGAAHWCPAREQDGLQARAETGAGSAGRSSRPPEDGRTKCGPLRDGGVGGAGRRALPRAGGRRHGARTGRTDDPSGRRTRRRSRRHLTLLRAENMTGFKGVCRSGSVSSNQFQAQLKHDGRQKHLGNFATAESAALAVARFLRSEGITAAEADAWSSARRSCKPLFRIM